MSVHQLGCLRPGELLLMVLEKIFGDIGGLHGSAGGNYR